MPTVPFRAVKEIVVAACARGIETRLVATPMTNARSTSTLRFNVKRMWGVLLAALALVKTTGEDASYLFMVIKVGVKRSFT